MYEASLRAGWGWPMDMSVDEGLARMIDKIAELERNNLANHSKDEPDAE
jgi:hypothetical protein